MLNPLPPHKLEKMSGAAFADSLGFISGLGPIIRPNAPVGLALGCPVKSAVMMYAGQGPVDIINDIAGEAKLTAGADNAVGILQEFGRDNPAFIVPGFRPGIRKQDKQPVKRPVRDGVHNLAPVALIQADIGKGFVLRLR